MLADQGDLVTMLKIYMDESGTHDDSPVITVGAYIARPEAWRDWTKVWNKRKRPIKVFHSNDCANLWGEFAGWEKTERGAFVARLLPTIPEHNLAGFVMGIRMDDFREVSEDYPGLAKGLGTPYTACFHWVVQEILEWLETIPSQGISTQRLAFFHEVNNYMGETVMTFDLCKKLIDKGRRKMSLTFGGKDDFVPLQAADILAYEANKRLRNPDAKDRRAWTAINPNKDRREMRYFDKASLLKLARSRYPNGVVSA